MVFDNDINDDDDEDIDWLDDVNSYLDLFSRTKYVEPLNNNNNNN